EEVGFNVIVTALRFWFVWGFLPLKLCLLSINRQQSFQGLWIYLWSFVENNVKLRGKLHRHNGEGLEVEHIPISIPFITAIQRKWQPKGLLLVRLAGVELAPSGMAWLQQELKPQQMMWFQLLGREDLALECLVLVNKGRFLSVCLNEEIL
uniref:Uncharacterized protein n=1 Tax=Strigops habroptila TaxID=2489341 RepID=A0A672UI98_STRHB